jgi:hypothetical protein
VLDLHAKTNNYSAQIYPFIIFRAALTRDLARCAALERESMAIIAELAVRWRLAALAATPLPVRFDSLRQAPSAW